MIYGMSQKMGTVFEKLTKNVLNLIYPPQCLVCKMPLEDTGETHLCKRCVGEIRSNPKPWCDRCGRSVGSAALLCPECRRRRPSFERAYSACLYEGPLRKCIHQFKYRGRSHLSSILSKLMTDFIKENPEVLEGADAVAYVPLSGRRLKEREYNQSRLLAAEISREFAMPLIDALIKTRSTLPQSELKRKARLDNIKGTFGARPGLGIQGLGILLIDDVLTTGATLDECSRVLLNGGAKRVIAFTLARGV